MPNVPTTCPRCNAIIQTTPLTPPDSGEAYGCTRCTWPNPSYTRMRTTLARHDVGQQSYDTKDPDLEDFAARIKDTTVLKDPHGRMVSAKVVEIQVREGQVDVTFEFDPNGWQVPS